jgi:aryl-alcohol dehydrogenase-like predicted oxidoreductase
MEYRQLGRTDTKVSALCLGTMTWGEQNTPAEAFAQMDAAVEAGINFFDTAEMYPVPPRAETYARTEEIIGEWFKTKGQRDKIILASKIVGPSSNMGSYIRNGYLHFDVKSLDGALNASLSRLKTDYIDLYQLHWPDRHTNFFGQLGYQPKPDDPESAPIAETLKHLSTLVQAGKIRHIGLSNETPWGTMKFLALAEQHGLERVVSIQNPYNLLNRTFEIGLAEIAHREQVGLLAYSPLAFGVLSGKYRQGARPPKARLTLYERFSRYNSLAAQTATEAYVDLAETFELSPAQMALSYVTSRPFVTSNIIGATTLEQLSENIESLSLKIDPTVLSAIEQIHEHNPNPCP